MKDVPRLSPHRFRSDDFRLLRGFVSAMFVDRYNPLLVFLTVTRRCNLSCGYCVEYDDVSAAVPKETLFERIDHLARLKTVVVNLNGGEPLLHPDIVEIVAYIRRKGMVAAMNSNGFLLSRPLIRGLNEAGLHTFQISADAVSPNAVTQKALATLRPKFRALAEEARFHVRVNTVFGAAPPQEAVEVVRTALAHGFGAKVALRRNENGTPVTFDESAQMAWDEICRMEGRRLGVFGEGFQDRLLRRGSNEWKCRAGSRFFLVCEDGLVHRCSPRFGEQTSPLATYGEEDLRRAFDTPKSCASTCAVAFAHQVSRLDAFRGQRGAAPERGTGSRALPIIA